MKTSLLSVLSISLLLSSGAGAPNVRRQAVQGGAVQQVDERVIAQRLLGADVVDRSTALGVVERLPPAAIGAELRAALIGVLMKENGVRAEGARVVREGGGIRRIQDPEFRMRVARALVGLQDPQTIPALAGALGTGFTVLNALSAFGEPAAYEVLRVVEWPESTTGAINDGLIALRFMVEASLDRPLAAGTLGEIRRVAGLRLLDRNQGITTLWRAIDLAVTLNDPRLTRVVQALASDPNETRERGVDDPQLILVTQRHATDRLAGVPALPRLRKR